MEYKESTEIDEFSISYNIGKNIGEAEGESRGFVRGFVGGALFLACLYAMNYYMNKIAQPQPQNYPAQLIEIEPPNIQSPIQIQPSFKSDLSDKFEEV